METFSHFVIVKECTILHFWEYMLLEVLCTVLHTSWSRWWGWFNTAAPWRHADLLYAASHWPCCRAITHMHSPELRVPAWDTMCIIVFFWGHVPMDLWTMGAYLAKALLFQLHCIHGRGFTEAMQLSGSMHRPCLGLAGVHQQEYAVWIRPGECLLNNTWRQKRKKT